MTILEEILIVIDDLQPISRGTIFNLFPDTPKAVIASAIARLINRGDAETTQEGVYVCTKIGNQKILETLEELENIRNEKSLSWHLCIFAIPEKNKVDREKLRLALRNHGFGKLRGGLFLAHRSSITALENLIASLRLGEYVSIISIQALPQTYLQHQAGNAWPWRELESEYNALIADIQDFLEKVKASPLENPRIIAKILVFRLATLLKKDPKIDQFLTSINISIPKDHIRRLYFDLKPYCYG